MNDLKQLDFKAKGTIGVNNTNNNINDMPVVSSSTSNSNLATEAANNAAKKSTENLYDEYRRRLELIKKVKPIK